jgi:hypothetical protein
MLKYGATAVSNTWAYNLPSNVIVHYFEGYLKHKKKNASELSENIITLAEAGITDLWRGVVNVWSSKATAVLKQLQAFVDHGC